MISLMVKVSNPIAEMMTEKNFTIRENSSMERNMTITVKWYGRMVRPIKDNSETDTCREEENSTWTEGKDNMKENLRKI